MSATILAFPGVDPARIRPRPTCLADLPAGAKALVITEDRGRYHVALAPAATPAERRVRQAFADAEDARYYARRQSIEHPRLYQLIIDNVPQRRPSLDEIMGPAPAGWDGAA